MTGTSALPACPDRQEPCLALPRVAPEQPVRSLESTPEWTQGQCPVLTRCPRWALRGSWLLRSFSPSCARRGRRRDRCHSLGHTQAGVGLHRPSWCPSAAQHVLAGTTMCSSGFRTERAVGSTAWTPPVRPVSLGVSQGSVLFARTCAVSSGRRAMHCWGQVARESERGWAATLAGRPLFGQVTALC